MISKKVIILIVVVIAILFILFLFRNIISVSYIESFSISPCISNGEYIFPSQVENISIEWNLINGLTIINVTGSGTCKRNIFIPTSNYLIITNTNGNTYVFSNLQLACENKEILNYNISVQCCSNSDCSKGYICEDFVCIPAIQNGSVYQLIYISFNLPSFPKCIGEKFDNELIGENVGRLCYTVEELSFNKDELSSCVYIDGIKTMTVYGYGNISFLFKYYPPLPNKIYSISVNGVNSFIIDDPNVRYICLLGNATLEKINVITYRYLVYQLI